MNNRVCMVVYNYYSWDARVRKEATALARNGYDITVICLRNTGEAREEIVNGVKVRRLPLRSERSGGKLRYAYQYIMFFAMAACAVSIAHIKRRFGVVHTHSLPDFIVFAAAFPKLTGAKVVLDLHEAMPEIYLSKMDAEGRGGFIFRLMAAQEKASVAFADRVVTVSDMVGDIFVERGLPREKLTIIWNAPDYEKPLAPVSDGGKRLVYAGGMNEYQDFDTVIDGLAELKDVELDIYGEGVQTERLRRKIAEMGLKNVRLKGWVESAEIKGILATYSGAVVPFVDSEITRIALGHKVLEYPLLGLPVIATDLPGIRAVFDDSCFYFYKVGDPGDFVRAAKSLLADRDAAARKVLISQEAIEKRGLTWGHMEKRLVDLYRKLGDE
jgi:glycosyltransferase involved in cell wall biosynthesis